MRDLIHNIQHACLRRMLGELARRRAEADGKVETVEMAGSVWESNDAFAM